MCEGVSGKRDIYRHTVCCQRSLLSRTTEAVLLRQQTGNLSHCPVLLCLLYRQEVCTALHGEQSGKATQDISVSWGGGRRHRQKVSPTEANKESA